MKIKSEVKNPIKSLFIKFSLAGISIFLCLVILEAILKTGYFDDTNNPYPIWIPDKYKRIDDKINAVNKAAAKNNCFGFNDRARKIKKEKGIYRIAVLGDSYIWGDGVPYETIWSHKLEKKVKEHFDKVEVLSWGRKGWSTLDEYKFLKTHGINYNIDLLIIGLGTNDPDMGNYEKKQFRINNKKVIRPLRRFLPNAVDFVSEHLDNIIDRVLKDWGYQHWKKRLYSRENLEKYTELLSDLSNFCSINDIQILLVLTPGVPPSSHCKDYNSIIPCIEKINIKYLNLCPAINKNVGDDDKRQFWANLANPHPGDLLTGIYAREVLDYLKKNILSEIR